MYEKRDKVCISPIRNPGHPALVYKQKKPEKESASTSVKGHRIWTKALLRQNHIGVIATTKGLLFFRTVRKWTSPYEYKRWAQIAAQSSGSVGTTALTLVKDVSNFDILKPTEELTLYQIFFGWNHPYLRVFTQIPKGSAKYGLENNQGVPEVTSLFGWDYEGFESPIREPSEASMILVPKDAEILFGLANPEDYAIEPMCRIIFNVMKVQPLDPDDQDHLRLILGVFRGAPHLWYEPNIVPVELNSFGAIFGMQQGIEWDGVVAKYNGKQLWPPEQASSGGGK